MSRRAVRNKGGAPPRLSTRVFLFPTLIGLANGAIAFSLKYWAHLHAPFFGDLEDQHAILRNNAIWSGLTSLVGFLLVFRVSQGYNRHWSAVTSAHLFSAEWLDAATALIAFTRRSKASESETFRLRQTFVRLFSLMHASALRDLLVEDKGDPRPDDKTFHMHVIDASTMDPECTAAFQSAIDRTNLVCHWIHELIVENMEKGVINVPPPILTRVFAELGAGLVKYHDALKAKEINFPVVYAYVCRALLLVHWALMPWITTTWVKNEYFAALFSTIIVFLMWILLYIARAFEEPFQNRAFWEDAHELQDNMNVKLAQIVSPMAGKLPSFGDNFDAEKLTVKRFFLSEEEEDSSGEDEHEHDLVIAVNTMKVTAPPTPAARQTFSSRSIKAGISRDDSIPDTMPLISYTAPAVVHVESTPRFTSGQLLPKGAGGGGAAVATRAIRTAQNGAAGDTSTVGIPRVQRPPEADVSNGVFVMPGSAEPPGATPRPPKKVGTPNYAYGHLPPSAVIPPLTQTGALQ